MQGLSSPYYQHVKLHFPEQEKLKCPRCDSTNTKFCYYNNYNLSQPRHFCKNCRRYWTKGGALRNIPVGGGTRKNNNKRSSLASKRSSSSETVPSKAVQNSGSGQDPNFVDGSGGQLGNVLQGLETNGLGLKMLNYVPIGGQLSGSGSSSGLSSHKKLNVEVKGGDVLGCFGMQSGESSYWSGNFNGWPNLTMHAPSSGIQ